MSRTNPSGGMAIREKRKLSWMTLTPGHWVITSKSGLISGETELKPKEEW